MKKLNLMLITLLLLSLSTGSAFAMSFYWDLTGTNTTAAGVPAANGGDAVNFPTDMTTSGGSTINQSFTGGADDNVLDDGDTFTEFGGLNIVSSGQFPGDFPFTFSGDYVIAYITYSGLSGTVADHDDGGTPTDGASTIADDTYSLNFTPGVGEIKVYLDNDIIPNEGDEFEIASLELVSGTGTSPFVVEGFLEGQFGLVAEFISVEDGFWNTGLFGDPNSQDFDDILALNLDIFAESFNLGATLESVVDAPDDGDGVIIDVTNEGSFILSVVPEPTTMFLFGFGLLGLAGVTRRKTA